MSTDCNLNLDTMQRKTVGGLRNYSQTNALPLKRCGGVLHTERIPSSSLEVVQSFLFALLPIVDKSCILPGTALFRLTNQYSIEGSYFWIKRSVNNCWNRPHATAAAEMRGGNGYNLIENIHSILILKLYMFDHQKYLWV